MRGFSKLKFIIQKFLDSKKFIRTIIQFLSAGKNKLNDIFDVNKII